MSLNYPLEWPARVPRTKVRSKSRFDVRSLAYALDHLCQESWWQVLELEPSASEDDIRHAARVLMGKYHLDSATADSEAFHRVTRAREEGLKAVGA